MPSAEENGVVVAKLDDGEDLLACLRGLAAEHRLESGLVLWGIGMVRDFELGYFNGRQYDRKIFAEPAELLALHGTLTPSADPPIHVHLTAGKRGHEAVGGHLFKATVNVLNEICLQRLDRMRLGRELKPASGLRELCIYP